MTQIENARRNSGNTTRRVCIALAVVLTAVGGSACRESSRVAMVSPVPDARPLTATLGLERAADNDSSYTVTLRLDSAAAISRVGSVTASIDFDSSRVRFVGDVSPPDNALRAAHVDRGRLRVAAASAQGLAADALIRLSFVTHDPAALTAMQLLVSELHLLDATDLKRTLHVVPPSGMAPIAPTMTPAIAR